MSKKVIVIVLVIFIVGVVWIFVRNRDFERIEAISESQFKGTIIESYSNGSYVVEPEENEAIRKSADKISVRSDSNTLWEVGTKVIVTYTGEVMESYPAQIKAIDVVKY